MKDSAAMSETIDLLVWEDMEEKAECAQKLSAMSDTNHKLVLEKAEERAESEQKLAAMLETIDKLVLEKMEVQKAECERKMATMWETIDILVLEKAEERAEFEQKLATMSETIDKLVLEKMEIHKAECERKMAAMWETIDKLVLEKAEEKTQMSRKVAALENRALQLEQAAQAISAEKAECEQKLAAMSEMIDKLVQEKTEEKMTAKSADPVTTAPTEPGSHDPKHPIKLLRAAKEPAAPARQGPE
ncbi:hypothetical protein GJAV_G00182600 [Gymnothorax javanicus]|nr:hypothetical protein GJAV_G00182600 [Gymnothorax javanicus]